MINNKTIKKELIENPKGLTITQLQIITKLPRCQVRICLSYLLGSGEIEEMIVGKAKLYMVIK